MPVLCSTHFICKHDRAGCTYAAVLNSYKMKCFLLHDLIKGKRMQNMKKTIYIADDEENIRELIKNFLEKNGYDVRAFADGTSLLNAFYESACDLVILDIMMPGEDGLSICARIRKQYHVPIIIVSARDSEVDRITGITVGSDDYLVKPFSPLELVARVNALFRRMALDADPKEAKSHEEEKLLVFEKLSIDTRNRRAAWAGQPVELTPTELALMVYLVEHKDRAVSREELLKNVWKSATEDVDTRAADHVVKRLRKKLAGMSIQITSVWGFGFRIEKRED